MSEMIPCAYCDQMFAPYRHQIFCTPVCRSKDHTRKWREKPTYHEWKSWQQMRDRCNNPNHHAYRQYGGRGIKVCGRWDSFDAFLEDLGERPSLGHSLDRIDNNGNYEPGNCRWATSFVQRQNRSDSFPKEHEQAIRDGIARGYNFRQIGDLIGRSHGSVSAKAYRLGLKSGQPPIPARALKKSGEAK